MDDATAAATGMPEEIDVLASRDDDGRVAVLVWRHADDQYLADDTSARVAVRVTGLPDRPHRLSQLRIDVDQSYADTVWRALGSPQSPDADQLAALRERQGLEELEPSRRIEPEGRSG